MPKPDRPAVRRPVYIRILSWTLRIVLVLLVIFVALNAMMTFRSSDVETQKSFAEKGVPVQIHRIPFAGGELRYVETGLLADSSPLILFVHGAPGSGNNFYKYLSDSLLVSKYRLISIDRPGYGYSNYGQSEPSFRVQAQAVKTVLDRYRPSKTLLVGHSFGGPVIAQAALDYPDQVQALLMLAPVNDPDSEPVPWYAGFARWPLTRRMLSKAWQVSGDEKFAHVEELRRLQPRWKELRIPVTHLHGASDFLAPPRENLDFTRRNIPAEWLTAKELPQGNHFIPFTDFERVREILLNW